MSLYSELKRRNVLRAAVAYLAGAWLATEVAGTVLPAFGYGDAELRIIIIVLAIALVPVLALTWVFEITSEGVVLDKDAQAGKQIPRATGRRFDFVVISVLVAALLIFAWDKWSSTGHPVITEYRKLTDSKVLLPPVPSVLPLVVGDARIYFTDFSDGDYGIRQLQKTGGEAIRFDLGVRDREFVGLPMDVTPDGSALLLWGHDGDAIEWPRDSLWTIPVVGGSLRRLGEGRVGVYSQDGMKMAYFKGDSDLYVADADMGNPRQIATLPGRGYAPAFSPDGSRVRISVFWDPLAMNLWEVPATGGQPIQVFPDWHMGSVCCGSWTPDGRYYVFEAREHMRSQIWAVRDVEGAQPFQLTTGAIDYVRPTLSKDGRTIFASGWQLSGETLEYDPESGTYRPVPGLEGVSADQLDYSPDGLQVAYIRYPELTLWRKSVLEDDAEQLTFHPMIPARPRWSPDGRSIAFTGRVPGNPPSVYVVRAGGGELELISRSSWWPAWSPDGKELMYNEAGSDRPTVVDLATMSTRPLPGEGRFRLPSYSPDGVHVAGRSGDALVLHHQQTGQSRVITEGTWYELWYWSRDSRSLFVVDSLLSGSKRSVHRIDIESGDTVKIWQVGKEIGVFGSAGRWIGVTGDGKILMLRNHSIHNIYALHWNPR
jgi:Tol biopolymer transport system component